ncbi:MAG: PIN domain-containing protein [Chloroflexota bacterium]
MRPAILFLDTNILLDCPRPEDYRVPGRQVTVVVIPEVMRELRGLARARDRGQAGAALMALGTLEPLAQRRGSALGVPAGRSGTTFRILPGTPVDGVSTDRQLVLRAKAEQSRVSGPMVMVVTRDWGVAEVARAERVKTILIRGYASPAELERGIAEHDSSLDIDL